MNLQEKHRRNLEYLSMFDIRGSREWMDENLPDGAIPYIKEQRKLMDDALKSDSEDDYTLPWTRYYKAMLRAWELMASEKTKGVPLEDVELEYFRHLPDGNEIVMSSDELGGEFVLVPRRPKKQDPDKRYMTANNAKALEEAPIIARFIKEFDAWFKM